MTKEDLIKLKEKISKLSEEEKIQRDLYLRDLANGELQGPSVGYPSIDKPWLKYYTEEQIKHETPKKTCYDTIVDLAKTNPNNTVVNYFDTKINYQQFLDKVNEVAGAYKSIGVKKGDIVTILPINTPEILYSFFALNKIGAISNMIDVRSNVEGLKKYIDEVNSKYILSLDLCADNVKKAIGNDNSKTIITYSAFDSIQPAKRILLSIISHNKSIKDDRFIKWNKFINKSNKKEEVEKVNYVKNYPVSIVHTGGTTGVPKGVLLSNDDFNAVAYQVKNTPFNLEFGDKFLNILVPFVAYGLTLGIYTPVTLGWESILIPKFETKNMVKLMKKYDPQIVMGIETYYDPLVNSDDIDYTNTKIILMGGMPTKEEFEKRFNNKIKNNNGKLEISKGYSMTENSSTATCSFNNVNESGSNGVPLTKTIVSTFDSTTNEELGYNIPGELCILAPQQMLGYYGKPEETSKVIVEHEDGTKWIHSGDIGYVTSDGFIYVVDRIKRMIIRSGFKVFPSEIENVFLKNDNVENCAVVAVDDEIDDKAPKAYVVKKENSLVSDDELICQLQDSVEKNGLPKYFIPSEFEIIDKLPLTNVGKVDFKNLEDRNKKLIKK